MQHWDRRSGASSFVSFHEAATGFFLLTCLTPSRALLAWPSWGAPLPCHAVERRGGFHWSLLWWDHAEEGRNSDQLHVLHCCLTGEMEGGLWGEWRISKHGHRCAAAPALCRATGWFLAWNGWLNSGSIKSQRDDLRTCKCPTYYLFSSWFWGSDSSRPDSTQRKPLGLFPTLCLIISKFEQLCHTAQKVALALLEQTLRKVCNGWTLVLLTAANDNYGYLIITACLHCGILVHAFENE